MINKWWYLIKRKNFPEETLTILLSFPYSFLAKNTYSCLYYLQHFVFKILILFINKTNAVLSIMPILLLTLNFGEKILKQAFAFCKCCNPSTYSYNIYVVAVVHADLGQRSIISHVPSWQVALHEFFAHVPGRRPSDQAPQHSPLSSEHTFLSKKTRLKSMGWINLAWQHEKQLILNYAKN